MVVKIEKALHRPLGVKEEYVKSVGDIEDSLAEDLENASVTFGWSEVNGLDEKSLFDAQYNQIKQEATLESGLTAFYLYDKYKSIVEAAVIYFCQKKAEENFFGHQAKSTQVFIRQICTDTFGADVLLADRVFATGGSGLFYAVPRAAVGAADPGSFDLTDEKQMLVIFYYQNNLNPRTLERLQEEINDDIGARRGFGIYSQSNRANRGIITRPGIVVVEDDKEYQLFASSIVNANVDILPQGVEILTASQATAVKDL